LAATHIINKLPMATLSWKTSFELLHGVAPTYDNLITIRCLCYAHTVGVQDKFDSQSTKCILLGYKLYDLQPHKIFHSRDVLFQEHVFPF